MNSLVPQWVDDVLACPLTHSPLQWHRREDGAAELISTNESGPRHAYPVTEGVPLLLASQARELA